MRVRINDQRLWRIALTSVKASKAIMCLVNIVLKTSKAKKQLSPQMTAQLTACPCKPETELFSSDRLLQSSQGIRSNLLLSCLLSHSGLNQPGLCNKDFSALKGPSERRTNYSTPQHDTSHWNPQRNLLTLSEKSCYWLKLWDVFGPLKFENSHFDMLCYWNCDVFDHLKPILCFL